MHIAVNVLIWIHLLALGMGFAGGIGMSQVGPRLVAAAPDQRQAWWPMADTFTRVSNIGLLVLLVTGPLILWLKYGDLAGLNGGFAVKMALVLLAIIAIGFTSVGKARLKRGDEAGGRLMMVAGPITTLLMFGVVLAAVFAFE